MTSFLGGRLEALRPTDILDIQSAYGKSAQTPPPLLEVDHHSYVAYTQLGGFSHQGYVHRLQRRVAYGGKKGRAATRKLRVMSSQWCTDRELCAAVFRRIDVRAGKKTSGAMF